MVLVTKRFEKKTYVEQSVCVSRGFQHDEQLIWRLGQ